MRGARLVLVVLLVTFAPIAASASGAFVDAADDVVLFVTPALPETIQLSVPGCDAPELDILAHAVSTSDDVAVVALATQAPFGAPSCQGVAFPGEASRHDLAVAISGVADDHRTTVVVLLINSANGWERCLNVNVQGPVFTNGFGTCAPSSAPSGNTVTFEVPLVGTFDLGGGFTLTWDVRGTDGDLWVAAISTGQLPLGAGSYRFVDVSASGPLSW